jgi:DinB superfamily
MTIGEAIDKNYARLERRLLQVAEAMPEGRYSFKPTPDIRSFGEQLRHIGAVQWVIGAGLRGENPPVHVGDGDSGPLSMAAKSEILKYTFDSFAYVRTAVRIVDERNALEMIPHPFDPQNTRIERLALIAGYASHGWEHYGQMVVYQRMNGIVPPPSRSN